MDKWQTTVCIVEIYLGYVINLKVKIYFLTAEILEIRSWRLLIINQCLSKLCEIKKQQSLWEDTVLTTSRLLGSPWSGCPFVRISGIPWLFPAPAFHIHTADAGVEALHKAWWVTTRSARKRTSLSSPARGRGGPTRARAWRGELRGGRCACVVKWLCYACQIVLLGPVTHERRLLLWYKADARHFPLVSEWNSKEFFLYGNRHSTALGN